MKNDAIFLVIFLTMTPYLSDGFVCILIFSSFIICDIQNEINKAIID